MFGSFLDTLISAIGSGAGAVTDTIGDWFGPAVSATEFTPELASLGTAGTDAASVAASAAPAVAADAAPSFLSTGSAFDPGLVEEAAGPYGFDQSLAVEPAATAAAPPTAWESMQQIPGKWWQGVQNTPASVGDYVQQNPLKTLGTAGVLGAGLYSAANPPSIPKAPTLNFPAPVGPRNASTAEDTPGGPPRSPLVGRSGGFGVKPSSGVKPRGGNSGGFGI